MNWMRRSVLGQYLNRVLLALGSALVAIALSFVPYDAILQAIWVVISSMAMGLLFVRERLNEDDQSRYKRLFKSRFEFLQRTDPESLTTIFAENIRMPVLEWFNREHGVELDKVPNFDALDSLARCGDKPGQLIFRVGIQLGRWLEGVEPAAAPEILTGKIGEFIDKHEHLLGQQIQHGIYYRELKPGDQRPVGVHMFSDHSFCLFTVEHFEGESDRFSVALSLKRELFQEYSDDQWSEFTAFVHAKFPEFKPINGGSGPQKRKVPLFIANCGPEWQKEPKGIAERLRDIAGPLVEIHS